MCRIMLNTSGGASDSTPYFKVYIHEPVKSSGNSMLSYNLLSHEYNVKMYKVI